LYFPFDSAATSQEYVIALLLTVEGLRKEFVMASVPEIVVC